MRKEYWFAGWVVIVLVGVAYILPPSDDHWSMVYEAIQVPELVCDDFGNCVPGDQKRFVLFNEDGLTRLECTDLFEKLESRNGIGQVTVQAFREHLVKNDQPKALAQRVVTEKFMTYL